MARRMPGRGISIFIMVGHRTLMIGEIQRDIAEKHVLVFFMADKQMLYVTDGAGDGRLRKDQGQRHT